MNMTPEEVLEVMRDDAAEARYERERVSGKEAARDARDESERAREAVTALYAERDALLAENARLGEDLARLQREVEGPAFMGEPVQPDWSRDVDAMVERFLAWPLPDSVRPDLATVDPNRLSGKYHDLTGTNLLTASEARRMLLHVFGPLVPTLYRAALPAHTPLPEPPSIAANTVAAMLRDYAAGVPNRKWLASSIEEAAAWAESQEGHAVTGLPAPTPQPGWKLVPVEPTPEMLAACDVALRARWDQFAKDERPGDDVRLTTYRAMLAAAPTPQGVEDDDDMEHDYANLKRGAVIQTIPLHTAAEVEAAWEPLKTGIDVAAAHAAGKVVESRTGWWKSQWQRSYNRYDIDAEGFQRCIDSGHQYRAHPVADGGEGK